VENKNSTAVFYKNKWVWIFIVFILVVGLQGAYSSNLKLNSAASKDEANQQQEQDNRNVTEQSISPTERSEITSQKNQFHHSQVVINGIEKGFATEAEPDKYYSYKKYIVLKNKDFSLMVEDFWLGFIINNPASPCQLAVQIVLDNPSDDTVHWSYRSFKVVDSQAYVYSPAEYEMRGDLSGEILPRELRRTTLVFNVPPIQQNFVLTYTDPDDGERVNFYLDVIKRTQEQRNNYTKPQEGEKEKQENSQRTENQKEKQQQQNGTSSSRPRLP